MDDPRSAPEAPSDDPIGALAEVLARWARREPSRLKEELARLDEDDRVELALRLPAQSRLELLLHAPQPLRLVRRLPDGEFHRTVRGVEPTEAMPLLSLGSPAQILHLLDLECWRGDRFDAARAGAWVAVLVDAGDETVLRLLRHADDEFLALLLVKWLRLEPIVSDENPEVKGSDQSESGDERGAVTPDGFHRFNPIHPEHGPAASRILRHLFAESGDRYSTLLWLANAELPSVLEERALHWRSSRMEEHGWPRWEEAQSIYAPPSPDAAAPERHADGHGAPVASRLPLRMERGAPWLARLAAHPSRESVLFELGALANRVLVSDTGDPGDPEAQRDATARAVSIVQLGLETTHGDLDGRSLTELFRTGWAAVEALADEGRRFVREDWPSTHRFALRFLDPPLDSRLDALVQPRPKFLELAEDGTPSVRDFVSRRDLEATRGALKLARVLGHVFFGRLGLLPEEYLGAGEVAPAGETPRFSTFFLTLLAQWHTRRALSLEPLEPESLRPFLRDIAHRDAPAGAGRAAVRDLLGGLGELRGLEPETIGILERYSAGCLARLRTEMGRIDPSGPLDERWVPSLLVRAARSHETTGDEPG